MARYFIITRDEVKIYVGDEYDAPEWGHHHDIIEAETRGKAKAEFCRRYGLEWIEPLKINNLPNCIECNNTGYGSNDDEPCLYCLGSSVYPGGFEFDIAHDSHE